MNRLLEWLGLLLFIVAVSGFLIGPSLLTENNDEIRMFDNMLEGTTPWSK